MKTLLISLKRRKDRRNRVLKHLPEMGLDDIILLDAVDGKDIPLSECPIPPPRPYFSFKDEFGNPSRRFNRYQVGCTRSHIEALKTVISENLPYALIVEDDLELTKDLSHIEDTIKTLPDDWEMAYLGYAERHWANKSSSVVNEHWKVPGMCDGLQAYLVTERGAKKLIAEMSKMNTTNDDAVNDARFERTNPLKAYALRHKIAFQIEDFSELDRRVINRKDLRE